MVKIKGLSAPNRHMRFRPILFHVIIRVQASICREENSINTSSHASPVALLQPVKNSTDAPHEVCFTRKVRESEPKTRQDVLP